MGTTRPSSIPGELEGKRLDAALRALAGASWGEVRRLIARGKVFVDGSPVLDPAHALRRGATVEVRPDAPRPRDERDLDPSRVVHLDRHLVVLDKPSGLATVPYEEGERGTLVDLLRRLVARLDPGGPRSSALPSLHVVQRLDRGTSGLVVVARSRAAAEGLRAQLREHSAHRSYLALAHGAVEAGTLRSHLLGDRGDGLRGSRERARPRGGRRPAERGGKLAVTRVEPVEALAAATLLRCRLETGRTNQIRIHLSEAGHPLLGETVYLRGYPGEVLPAPRLMLHAAELGFVHPATARPCLFARPLPEDMAGVLEALRRGATGAGRQRGPRRGPAGT